MELPTTGSGHIRIRRQTKTIRRMSYYEREVQALFEELIHKPWGPCQWQPAADVIEDQNSYTIELDLPGIKKQDVRVIIKESRRIIIEGHRDSEQPSGHLIVAERPHGAFCRFFEFPQDVNESQVEITDDGCGTIIIQLQKND